MKIRWGSGTHKHTCKRGAESGSEEERYDGIRVRDWRMRASALKVEDHFISQGAQEPEAGKGKE